MGRKKLPCQFLQVPVTGIRHSQQPLRPCHSQQPLRPCYSSLLCTHPTGIAEEACSWIRGTRQDASICGTVCQMDTHCHFRQSLTGYVGIPEASSFLTKYPQWKRCTCPQKRHNTCTGVFLPRAPKSMQGFGDRLTLLDLRDGSLSGWRGSHLATCSAKD